MVLDGAGFGRALVIFIHDAVVVGIGATVEHLYAGHIRAIVFFVHDAVTVLIRATAKFFETRIIGALVIFVGDLVTITVRTSLEFRQSRIIGAEVIFILHVVLVTVRTSFELPYTRGIGAGIFFIRHVVMIAVVRVREGDKHLQHHVKIGCINILLGKELQQVVRTNDERPDPEIPTNIEVFVGVIRNGNKYSEPAMIPAGSNAERTD